MSPINWALRPLKKYATFSGRAPRAEFWWFFLFLMIVYFAITFAIGFSAVGIAATQSEPTTGMLASLGAATIFVVIFWLALLIPMIAVQVRRLHDTNRSGWWLGGFYLLYFIYMILTFGLIGSSMTAAVEGSAGAPASAPGGGMVMGIMVFGLLFFVYAIALLIFYCLPGTTGPNKYGADPYGGDLDEVFA
jgi:uncharacterized membrane protein YhaH (DUF805 family)